MSQSPMTIIDEAFADAVTTMLRRRTGPPAEHRSVAHDADRYDHGDLFTLLKSRRPMYGDLRRLKARFACSDRPVSAGEKQKRIG